MQDGRHWKGWILGLGLLLGGCLAVIVYGGADWREAIAIREEKGRNVRALDLAMSYGWWAAVINGVVLAALMLTVRLWSRPTSGYGVDERGGTVLSKWFWVTVAVAILAGAALRLPRMELSLYNDEAYTLRRQVSGEFKNRADGPEFREALWSETVWENEIANNPVLFSILARVSYGTWKRVTGGADGEVNEFWYRFPSLVAGLLGIGAVAWFSLVFSRSVRVAGLAAWLTAFHPWHVRYSTEARGYGLLLLLVPLMLAAFLLALRTGKWRWWILFAVAQFLAASTFVGVLYFSVVLNGAVVCWLGWRWRKEGAMDANDGGEQVGGVGFFPGRLSGRLMVGNTISGVLFLSVMLPHLVQIREALSVAVAHRGMGVDWTWWPDALTYLSLGMPWFDGASGSEINPAVVRIFGQEDGRTILGAVLGAAILLGLGIWNAWRSGPAARCLVVALAVTPAFYFAMTVSGGNALYRWHMIFLLPVVTATAAFGVSWRSPGAGFKLTSGGVIRIVLAMMLFGGYSTPLERYVRNPKENPRALVEQARGGVYPGYLKNEKQVAFAAFNCVGVYDPYVEIRPTKALIRGRMDSAEAEGKEFYVMFARRPLVAADVIELLEQSGEFELVGREPGLEESQYTNYLFKARTVESGKTEIGE